MMAFGARQELRQVRPIHRPWPLIAPALWAGVARGIPPHLSRVSALADAWGRALGLYEPDGSRGDLEEREDGGGGAWGRHLGLQGRGYTPLTRSQGP